MTKNSGNHKEIKYNYDIAEELGICEGEVINKRLGKDVKIINASNIKDFISDLEALGEVKCITRNSGAVSVQQGKYTNQYLNGYKKVNISAEAGLVLNPGELDIRMFFKHWNAIFYIDENKNGKQLKSFQIFDRYGKAIHKIFITELTNLDALYFILEKYKCDIIKSFLFTQKKESDNYLKKDCKFDDVIDRDWREMKEVHDFYILMNKYKMSRQQLFNSVGDDLAYQVDNTSLNDILLLTKEKNEALTVFIANTGCVQIYTGLINKIFYRDEWLNIFNNKNKIHLRHESIDECWVVRKPGEHGYVTSLEVFSKYGEQIVQIYGQRNENEKERDSWRNIISSI